MSDVVIERKKSLIFTDLVDFQKRLNSSLDQADKSTELTSVLGFVSGGKNWLLDLSDLKEVESVPPKNNLPRIQLAKSWVLGVANFKGYIYTMVDFQMFLGGSVTTLSMNARSLLLGHKFLIQAALVVPEVLGLMGKDSLKEVSDSEVPNKSRWTRKSYKAPDGTIWEELDVQALSETREMIDIEA